MTVGPYTYSVFIPCIFVCLFVCMYVCLLMHLPNPLAKVSLEILELWAPVFGFMTVGPYTYSVFIPCIFVCLFVCMLAPLMHLPNPLAKASVLFFQLRTRLEI
jgi:hypothetical protein